MKKRQAQYKIDHSKGVRHLWTVTAGDEVFIDGPPTAEATLDVHVSDIPWSKLLPRLIGPFPVRSVTNNTVVVELPCRCEHMVIFRVVKVPGKLGHLPRVASLSPPPFGDGDIIVDCCTSRIRTSYRVQWNDRRPPLWAPLADIPFSAVFAYHERSGLRFVTSQFQALYLCRRRLSMYLINWPALSPWSNFVLLYGVPYRPCAAGHEILRSTWLGPPVSTRVPGSHCGS